MGNAGSRQDLSCYSVEIGLRRAAAGACVETLVIRCLNQKETHVKPIIGAFAVMLVTVGRTYTLAQPAQVAQPGLESAILRRAAANIQTVEPAWRFVSALCNCPPLGDEQVGVAAGSWEQPASGTSVGSISVRVHTMANAQAASQWIDRATHRNADGWTVAGYDLGDGGYAATYHDGRRYEINFRKGRSLGFVSGEGKVDVERFARYLLTAISESQ